MMLPEGLPLKVCWLIHKDESCPTKEYLVGIYAVDREFFASAIDVLSKLEIGRYHKMPWTRSLKGKDAQGLLEARVMGGPNRQLGRFPFFYSPRREVILEFGFTKKDGDAPPHFIAKARLYKELIEKGELGYEPIDLSFIRKQPQPTT
jgi:hypothetical protein